MHSSRLMSKSLLSPSPKGGEEKLQMVGATSEGRVVSVMAAFEDGLLVESVCKGLYQQMDRVVGPVKGPFLLATAYPEK